MNLHLRRTDCGPECSIGTLYVDGRAQCYTLEDADREEEGRPVAEWKQPGRSAIPLGRYRVTRTYSKRFGKVLPLISGVHGFTGIRIHPGNSAADTEGCILVGTDRTDFRLTNSRVAFSVLDAMIFAAIARGEEVWLEIT